MLYGNAEAHDSALIVLRVRKIPVLFCQADVMYGKNSAYNAPIPSKGYLKTKRKPKKYLGQQQKTGKTHRKKSEKNTQNNTPFFIAHVFKYPDSKSVFVTGTA